MIPFTQYLLPDGRQRRMRVNRNQETERRAGELMAAGYEFTCEILTTGEVSLECALRGDEEPLVSAVCENGVLVLNAVDKLIADAYERVQLAGLH